MTRLKGEASRIGKICPLGRLNVLIFFAIMGIVLNYQVRAEAQDNTLAFSTYHGGSQADTIRDVATDSQGNIYLTGGTASPDFLVTTGSYDTIYNGGTRDVFVMKLDPQGIVLWSTFLGGPNYDRAYAIEVDSQGYVYVAGRAGAGYPTTPGVVQPTFGGDVNPNPLYGLQDGFVTKLSPDGAQVIWSTYFGGDGKDFIRDMDVDAAGNVYLAISAVDRPHPHITPGAFQPTLKGSSDGAVAQISSDGSQVVYASYFGGSTADGWTPSIRVDSGGNAYFLTASTADDVPITPNAYQPTRAGQTDMVLAKIAPSGALIYSTYFGGSDAEFTETHGLAIDDVGHAYIAATTKSTNLPVTPGAFQATYGGSGGASTGGQSNYPGDGFVAKFSPDGSTLLAATYLGGSLGEGIEGVGVDRSGKVYVSGATYSSNFPVTPDAFQSANGGQADFFAVTLSADFSQLIYSTYLGGRGTDYGRTATAEANGTFYVAGDVDSTNWPTWNALQATYGGNTDGALAKFTPNSDTTTPAAPTKLRATLIIP